MPAWMGRMTCALGPQMAVQYRSQPEPDVGRHDHDADTGHDGAADGVPGDRPGGPGAQADQEKPRSDLGDDLGQAQSGG